MVITGNPCGHNHKFSFVSTISDMSSKRKKKPNQRTFVGIQRLQRKSLQKSWHKSRLNLLKAERRATLIKWLIVCSPKTFRRRPIIHHRHHFSDWIPFLPLSSPLSFNPCLCLAPGISLYSSISCNFSTAFLISRLPSLKNIVTVS